MKMLFLIWALVSASPNCKNAIIHSHQDIFGVTKWKDPFEKLANQQIEGRLFSSPNEFAILWNHSFGIGQKLKLRLTVLKQLLNPLEGLQTTEKCPPYNGPVRQVTHIKAFLGLIWYLSSCPAVKFDGSQYVDLIERFLKARVNIIRDRSQPDYGILDYAIAFQFFSQLLPNLSELRIRGIKKLFLDQTDESWSPRQRSDLENILNQDWGMNPLLTETEISHELENLEKLVTIIFN